jgi:hypothetical protein
MKRHQYLDEMAKFVGLFVMFAIGAALLIGLVYGLIGNLSERGIHILATALVFGVVGAFLLGLQVGKAHVKGVERGLDLKIGARERTQAKPTAAQPPAARFDGLLPKVDQGAVIVARQDGDTTPIDL